MSFCSMNVKKSHPTNMSEVAGSQWQMIRLDKATQMFPLHSLTHCHHAYQLKRTMVGATREKVHCTQHTLVQMPVYARC